MKFEYDLIFGSKERTPTCYGVDVSFSEAIEHRKNDVRTYNLSPRKLIRCYKFLDPRKLEAEKAKIKQYRHHPTHLPTFNANASNHRLAPYYD